MQITVQPDKPEYLSYFKTEFQQVHSVAKQARSKGLDPSFHPEPIVAEDLAERVEKSVGPPNLSQRIRDLRQQLPREEVAFKVAEEIIYGKFGSMGEKSAEQAIRTALAILDEGVTAAPLQGISEVKVKLNSDKTRYLSVYFAGPIRSAGGTEMGLILVVADFVRKLLGLDRYKATEQEANRFVEEVRVYEREAARFQYRVSDKELFTAIMNLPVEVNGVETDPVEVASFRNLSRIETNRVRGGALRVVNDGVIGRSQKLLKIVEKLGINGWSWLKDLKPIVSETEEAREFMFMEDVVGGRPIFSFPGMEGGFRLRYGRARNTGLASMGVHPATMHILEDFIAIGTQLRVEKPGKAGVASAVDTIEPPLVLLENGDVVRLESMEQARAARNSLKKIIFLGDILVGFGEFLENNRPLSPSGFVEEWWSQLLELSLAKLGDRFEGTAEKAGLDPSRIKNFIESPLQEKPTAMEALNLCRTFGLPMHPKFTYFWDCLAQSEILRLVEALAQCRQDQSLVELALTDSIKTILEKLGVPHRVRGSRIVIGEDWLVLTECLQHIPKNAEFGPGMRGVDFVARYSKIKIFPKVGVYIGARMGRPEKAKQREMRPIVHSLFPIGLAGGSRRNIIEAASQEGVVSIDIVRRKCSLCGSRGHEVLCPSCNEKTHLDPVCPNCGRQVASSECPACKIPSALHAVSSVNLRDLVERARTRLKANTMPETVKGVKGLTNETKTPEVLEKGILRALHDVSIFKDGTIRFDATNAPLTAFRPAEVGADVAKLKMIGYAYDLQGDPLERDDQLIPLQFQDIVIPESCGQYFLKVAAFLDEMLERLYQLEPYYRIRRKEDLIGHLVVGLSPHTSVGVIGRIIGFTKASVCYAHPLWHAAKRRDADGDEDSVSLLLDTLLNFSKAFLPSRIGGIMDAALLLTLILQPSEVARQAFNAETIQKLPLRFFEETLRGSDPKQVSQIVETYAQRLGTEAQHAPWEHTHDINSLNSGNLESSYKVLSTMFDKVEKQLALAEKVRAVKAEEVARRVLSTHFMRDLTGNLKAFSSQKMRCTKCNAKYRRIPLRGVCTRCGGKIALTVYKGTIEKYLDVANQLVKRYNMGSYHEQRLRLIRLEIDSLFQEPEKKNQQHVLGDFV